MFSFDARNCDVLIEPIVQFCQHKESTWGVCEVVVCWVEEKKSQNDNLHVHSSKRLPHAPSDAHYEYTGNKSMNIHITTDTRRPPVYWATGKFEIYYYN